MTILINKKKEKVDVDLLNWTSKGKFSIPLTRVQIAEALLDEAEFVTCGFSAETMIVDNHYRFNGTHQAMVATATKFKPECLVNKEVDFYKKDSYHTVVSFSKIEKKYKLSEFRAIGTKNKVIGISVSSLIKPENPQEHLDKYKQILKILTTKYENMAITPWPNEPCRVTMNCSVTEHSMFAKMYNEINQNQKVGKHD